MGTLSQHIEDFGVESIVKKFFPPAFLAKIEGMPDDAQYYFALAVSDIHDEVASEIINSTHASYEDEYESKMPEAAEMLMEEWS